jgi:hypothetical protein
MNKKERILAEIRTVILTTLYFFCWFGGLMVIKVLLLREYNIEFSGFTIVLVSALVIAKVVLLLEYIPIPYIKNKPAWVAVLIRTFFYLAGVFIIIVLEKSFEARHEHAGFIEAVKNLAQKANFYHVWANTICVFGALLVFNIWSVIKLTYGKGIFLKLMMSKIKAFE